MEIEIQGLSEAIGKLDRVDNALHEGLRRALYGIGALVKRAAVEYAPISPATGMLRRFSNRQKTANKLGLSRERANTMNVVGRRGAKMRAVTLTEFYDDRLNMLLTGGANTRPMPGGLMRSIAFRSDESKAEIFVPSNSLAGTYAKKIHDEKGSTWKERGPGTQAKGAQADDKFITRAAKDNESNIIAIITAQVDKALS